MVIEGIAGGEVAGGEIAGGEIAGGEIAIEKMAIDRVIRRGGIYLANFNPSRGQEPGKVRLCLVMQTDLLNAVGHSTVIVLPLTTRLIEDAWPLRYRLAPRDDLREVSDVMIDLPRSIDRQRIVSDALTQLFDAEMQAVTGLLTQLLC